MFKKNSNKSNLNFKEKNQDIFEVYLIFAESK